MDNVRDFVSEDPSNRDLMMSLLSGIDSPDTVVMTTTRPVSVQKVVDALDNGSALQPKVSRQCSLS